MRMTETELSGRTTKSGEKSSTTPARRLKLTRQEPTESDIQSAIMRALKIHPAVAWFGRFNSGAQVVGEGKKKRFIRFSSVKGLSDILGQLTDGRTLAIEVKRPSGRVSEDQSAFIEKVQGANGIAFIARSVSDVFEALDGVLNAQR